MLNLWLCQALHLCVYLLIILIYIVLSALSGLKALSSIMTSAVLTLSGNFILILVIHEYFSPISFRNLILLPLRTEFRELNKLDPFWFDMCRWKTFQGSEWKYYYISMVGEDH